MLNAAYLGSKARMKSIFSLFMIVAALYAGCASTAAEELKQNTIGEMQAAVNRIEQGRAISATEATAMANLYHRKHVHIESAVGPLEDKGDHWESVVFVGVAGLPRGAIRIEKASGRVSSNLGPAVDDPKTLAE